MQRLESFPYRDLPAMAKLGAFFWLKVKLQQLDHGTYQAARNLRKQGVPLDLALLALTRRT